MPLRFSAGRPPLPNILAAASRLVLFVLLFSTDLMSLQQLCMGLPDDSPRTISVQECSALAQLARQSNLSTNCNCSTHLSPSKLFTPCNESCAHARRHFASCTGGFSVSELYLSDMGLQGDMKWVANFKHIKHLDVSVNGFNGTIPSSLWSLGKLAYLNLSFNNISGHIPSFNGNTVNSNYPLKALDLSHNQIEGPFPHNLCVRFPNLTQFVLSSNAINGSAPLSLCNRLEAFDASFNKLQGSLLEDLKAKSTLKTLNLKQNRLNGSIPSLSVIMPNLVNLDVSYNNFSGIFGFKNYSIPSHLSRLNVSHNNLDVGLGADIIFNIGLSSFWPNRACKECFLHAITPSPSPSAQIPSSSKAAARTASPPSPRPTLSAKKTASHVKGRVDAILGIIVGCIAGVILITIILWVVIHKRRRKMAWPLCPKRPVPPFKNIAELAGPFSFESQSGTWIADVKDPSSVPVVIFEKPLMNLTFADLLQATKSFNREFEAGDGMGLVYSCVLPGVVEGDGKVTIEVVEDGHSLSPDAALLAFAHMGEVKHENLVPFLGYCTVGEEKLLIYKHMEGGSLEDALHAAPEEAHWSTVMGTSTEEDWHNMESWPDDIDPQARTALDTSKTPPCIDWETRHKVALGVARALAYMHNGCRRPAVHGAVSSSCILLDGSESKVAKVANYGGAWGLPRRLEPGYAPPECCTHMQMAASSSTTGVLHTHYKSNGAAYACTSRCDVYSTGVVLLELATGRRAVGNYGSNGCATLVAWVRMLRKGKRLEEAMDQRLPCATHPCLVEMMKVGCLCTAESPSKRPSMQQVVGLLKDINPP